jgi:hypothetical protein
MTSSIVSDYQSHQGSAAAILNSYTEEGSDSHAEVIPYSQPQPPIAHNYKPRDPATTNDARARELKAMQDIISALDSATAGSANSPRMAGMPSAWKGGLTVEMQGTSRLSMGEDLVTPGSYSAGSEEG